MKAILKTFCYHIFGICCLGVVLVTLFGPMMWLSMQVAKLAGDDLLWGLILNIGTSLILYAAFLTFAHHAKWFTPIKWVLAFSKRFDPNQEKDTAEKPDSMNGRKTSERRYLLQLTEEVFKRDILTGLQPEMQMTVAKNINDPQVADIIVACGDDAQFNFSHTGAEKVN